MKLTINSNILKLIPLLFDGSEKTIIAELLQNCRRAKAKVVHVTVVEIGKTMRVCVSDDGVGMDAAEMENLLALTGSGWTDADVLSEIPAGLGFLSLAGAIEVNVASFKNGKKCSVQFKKEHFSGAEATVDTEDSNEKSGTSVTFFYTKKPNKYLSDWLDAVRGVAEYSGVETILNGKKIPQLDFCNCDATVDMPEFGIRLGMNYREGLSAHHYTNVRFNFYGITMSAPTDMSFGIPGGVSMRVDVKKSTHLRMVLPARNAIHTDIPEELIESIRRKCFEFVASLEEHHLSFADYTTAKKYAPHIKEAAAMLTPAIEFADEANIATKDRVALDLDSKPLLLEKESDELMLFGYFNAADHTKRKVFDHNPRMQGYAWYDQIPKIEDIRLEHSKAGNPVMLYILSNGEEIYSDDLHFALEFDENQTESYFDGGPDITIGVGIKRTLDLVEEIEASVKACKFCANIDGSDSSETQEEQFEEECNEYVTRIVMGDQCLLLANIEKCFNSFRHGKLALANISMAKAANETGLSYADDCDKFKVVKLSTCIEDGALCYTVCVLQNAQNVDLLKFFADLGIDASVTEEDTLSVEFKSSVQQLSDFMNERGIAHRIKADYCGKKDSVKYCTIEIRINNENQS